MESVPSSIYKWGNQNVSKYFFLQSGLLHKHFSPCGKTAIIAQCTEENSVMDIYEVLDEKDFLECSNIPEHPAHYSNENLIEGFVVPFTKQPRFYVNKKLCDKGFKVKITYEHCEESIENPVDDAGI